MYVYNIYIEIYLYIYLYIIIYRDYLIQCLYYGKSWAIVIVGRPSIWWHVYHQHGWYRTRKEDKGKISNPCILHLNLAITIFWCASGASRLNHVLQERLLKCRHGFSDLLYLLEFSCSCWRPCYHAPPFSTCSIHFPLSPSKGLVLVRRDCGRGTKMKCSQASLDRHISAATPKPAGAIDQGVFQDWWHGRNLEMFVSLGFAVVLNVFHHVLLVPGLFLF